MKFAWYSILFTVLIFLHDERRHGSFVQPLPAPAEIGLKVETFSDPGLRNLKGPAPGDNAQSSKASFIDGIENSPKANPSNEGESSLLNRSLKGSSGFFSPALSGPGSLASILLGFVKVLIFGETDIPIVEEGVMAGLGDSSSGTTCPEVITRTYQAEDLCGNITPCTQLITIGDLAPPVITCPAGLTFECVGDVPLADIS